MEKRDNNLDIIKAMAIVSVILLHSLPEEVLFSIGAPYYIWQTVPVFMILAGYNNANSYIKRNLDLLGQLYSFSFLYKRLKRVILPFLLVWVVQSIILYITSGSLNLNILIKSLVTGGRGPGSYFVPIIIQATLLVPIIYTIMCKKNSTAMIVVLFILSLLLEFACLLLDISEGIYRLLIIRYVFALSLGVWLAFNRRRLKFLPLAVLAIISLVYITGVNYLDWNFIMEKFWLSQHAPSYFWPLGIIVLILTGYKFKGQNVLSRLFIKVGEGSYHIFLVQMIYFWIVVERLPQMTTALYACLNVIICLILGLLFYNLEKLYEKLK